MTATRHRARMRWLLVVLAVCATAAVVIGGARLSPGPAFVDKISVVNSSEFDIHVEASGGDGQGWVSVATADRASTTVAAQVLDQGTLWIFRFRAQGLQGGELRVTGSDLKRAGWSLQIPDSVIENLRQQGATPSP